MGATFDIAAIEGDAIEVAGHTIRPRTRAVRIALALPRGMLALAWSAPSAIVVQAPDGAERTLAVPDATRRVQVNLLVAGVVVTGLLAMRFVRRPDAAAAPSDARRVEP